MSFQTTVYGKYYLLDRIAVGGMAEVFKAKTFGIHGFERLLVIKRILPHLSQDEEFVQMFIDEAKISVDLNHANICQVSDFGKIGDNYFIAMEYIAGRDLRAILKKCVATNTALTVPMTLYLAMELLKGLDYAHRKVDANTGKPANIIHRDISPQNLMVSYDGDVKIVDFGIAKAESKISRTHAGVLKGKFGYMSPEQASGIELDPRTDIFSAGIILYEMLTRRRLFLGETDFDTLEKIKECAVPSPRKYNADIPPEIEAALLKALSKEREDRFANAQEFLAAIAKVLYTQWPHFSPRDLSELLRNLFAKEIAEEQESLRRAMDKIAASERALLQSNTGAISSGSAPTLSSNRTADGWVGKVMELFGKARAMVEKARASLPPSQQKSFRIGATALGAILGIFLGWKLFHRPPPPPPVPTPLPTVAGEVSVTISSDPDEAELFVDGDPKGMTPVTISLHAKRTYRARFSKKGFKVLEREILITEDQTVYGGNVLAKDLPVEGVLKITSDPPGAWILFDGEEKKFKTPHDLLGVRLNVYHNIKVVLPSYKSVLKENFKMDRAEESLHFQLERSLVALVLKITPKEAVPIARVTLDGKEKPNDVIRNLEAGKEYTLRVSAKGFKPFEWKVRPGDDLGEEEIAVPLQRETTRTGRITLRAAPWANIFVDGRKIVDGGPGIADYSLPVGAHDIEFRHPDYKTKRIPVRIRPGTNEPISVDMRM